MNKTDLEKNILDLSYKRNLQLMNIILISGIGTFFAYLGGLILNSEKSLPYTFAIILIGTITFLIYRNINENLREISTKIKNLI